MSIPVPMRKYLFPLTARSRERVAADRTLPTECHGSVSVVYELLERLIPGSSSHFMLALNSASTDDSVSSALDQTPDSRAASFTLTDTPEGKVAVTASGTSEITSGLAFYFRERCNMNVVWPRDGAGSPRLCKPPEEWPPVGGMVTQRRSEHTSSLWPEPAW